MSEMNDIIAPSLEQAGYGENINQQFQNIDKNFKSIVDNEYLKGDRGANIYIKPLELLKSGVLQDKFKALFNRDISDLKIGSINSKDLYMLYAQDENNNVTAVSSLPYTFLDPRFNPPPTDPTEMATLNKVEDKSCIVMYDESIKGFTTVNSFPTIYYNQSGVTTTGESDGAGSFCWKINNVETDLPAQGPKGDRGANGFVYFMMAGEEIGKNIYKVELYQDLYPNVTGKFDYSALDGHMGLVWHGNDWYMSPLNYDDAYGLLYSKNEDANIRNILATQSFCEIMLQSHPNNNLNSLFLPKDYPSDTIREKTPSHIITTARIKDEDYFGKNDNPKILILAPGEVGHSGIRTLKVPDEEHKFIIGYNNVKIGDKIETEVGSDGQHHTYIKTRLDVEGPTNITGYTRIDGNTRIEGDTVIDADTRLHGNVAIGGDTAIDGNTTIDGDTTIGGNATIDKQLKVDRITPNNTNDEVNEFYFIPAGLGENQAYPTYWKFLFSGELTNTDSMSKSGLIIGPPTYDKAFVVMDNDYQMHICTPDGILHIGNYFSRKSTRVYADIYADDIKADGDVRILGNVEIGGEVKPGDVTIGGNANIKGNLFLDGQGIDSKISAIIGENNQTFLSDYFIEDGAMGGYTGAYENENTHGEGATISMGYRAPIQIYKSVYYTDPNTYEFHSTTLGQNVYSNAAKYRIEINLTNATSFISQLRIQTAFIAKGTANGNKIYIELHITDVNGYETEWKQERTFLSGYRYNVETTITFKNNETIVSGFFKK